MPELVMYRGSGEWSALYVDGTLERVGDHYYVEERIFELLSVEIVQSDDFMRGRDTREDVASTLEYLEDFRVAREAALQKADELQAEAKRLSQEATRLREEYR